MIEEDIECSDEEAYFSPCQTFRLAPTGERIWEPPGPEIVKLYKEIEAQGYNTLEWQFPGKISPSLLSNENEGGAKVEGDTNEKVIDKNKTAFDDFDFDDPFGGGGNETKLNAKRSQHGQKKTTTTNLSKVMANMRRYKDSKGTSSRVPIGSTNNNNGKMASGVDLNQ